MEISYEQIPDWLFEKDMKEIQDRYAILKNLAHSIPNPYIDVLLEFADEHGFVVENAEELRGRAVHSRHDTLMKLAKAYVESPFLAQSYKKEARKTLRDYNSSVTVSVPEWLA